MIQKKSLCMTYFLWLFFGWFGVHHFYLGRDRHAFVWWSTLGGFFFLGWIRDLWKIPEYVDDANEEKFHMQELARKMKARDYPQFNTTRFLGEMIVGYAYGFLVRMALPAETSEVLAGALICFGMAVGIHLVGNIGREQGGFIKPLCAVLSCYLILSLISEPGPEGGPNYMYCVLVGVMTFNYIRKHRRTHKKSSFCGRVFTLSFCMMIIFGLWGSFFYFNAEFTTDDGETVKFRDSVNHFFTSPAWLEFTNTLHMIYEEGQKNGWRTVYDEFVKALDPKGEANARKVLNLKDTDTEDDIKKLYKKLVRQWHPDRHRDPVKKAEAQKKFMEIQNAYEILTSKKRSDSRPLSGRTEF